MSQPRSADPQSQPVLTSVAAHLYLRDLKASTDFFATKLGFRVDFVYGDPATSSCLPARLIEDKADSSQLPANLNPRSRY
jgi:hypothetical protein